MTTIGKDFPVRSDAFRFSSEKRASSAATSPARTECFDIFSAEPGDSDVTSQMERLSSKEMKIAARLDWMAVGASCRSATAGMVVSTVSVRNLTLPERWSLSTSPWDLWAGTFSSPLRVFGHDGHVHIAQLCRDLPRRRDRRGLAKRSDEQLRRSSARPFFGRQPLTRRHATRCHLEAGGGS